MSYIWDRTGSSLSPSSRCCSVLWSALTCKRSLIAIRMNRAAMRPSAQSAGGLSNDPHGEIAGADPDPHRTSRSAKGAGRDGGPPYLVQWDCPAGCRADGRGLDGGYADVRAMA